MFLPSLAAPPPSIHLLQTAPKSLPVYLVIHGEDPANTPAFPFLVEIEIQIKAEGSKPLDKSFVWKGEWKGFGIDLVEPLGELLVPKGPSPGTGEPPLLEGILKTLSITDAKGKAVLRLTGKDGPKLELGRGTRGLNFKINSVWKADGKLKLGLSLDPLE